MFSLDIPFQVEGPSDCGQSQGLPEVILSCLPFCLKKSNGWKETVRQQVVRGSVLGSRNRLTVLVLSG